MSTLMQAALVIFREGLEAILVIAAMAVYLKKMDAGHRVRALYCGAAAALVASVVFAWLFEEAYGGSTNSIVQSLIVFAAAGMMLYVSGWLCLGRHDPLWFSYFRKRVDGALLHQSDVMLGVLAFLAVFREGVETVIFIFAVPRNEPGWAGELALGLLLGILLLTLVFIVVTAAARQLTLRWSLMLTSLFLFAMAVVFLGEGVEILQESHLLHETPVVHGGRWLAAVGLNPTWEALALQVMVAVLAVLGAIALTRQPVGDQP